MKEENLKLLENLSKTAYWGGLLPIFLGVLVAFVGGIQKDALYILVGIFIFVTGYAYVKISQKIAKVIDSEKG